MTSRLVRRHDRRGSRDLGRRDGNALVSVWYTRRADQRASRAEARARSVDQVEILERIGGIVREVDLIRAATQTDPFATQRLRAASDRLHDAIALAGVPLPECAEYARTGDSYRFGTAQRELEQAIAAVRREG